ncbi:hypothetical protein [Brevibacterium luteolum]|uniref:hypothetical protein n=1 Tax=Brevibacterium luteolum TaxID=199591 RepID=UPI00223B66C4|nr:hypothetical protein [Brevibacterium luteolum]MCT1657657.1 hypothetical protein [Brevibacterium luteolum]
MPKILRQAVSLLVVTLFAAAHVALGWVPVTAVEAPGTDSADAPVSLKTTGESAGRLHVDTRSFARAVGPVTVRIDRSTVPEAELAGRRLPAAVQMRPQTTGHLPVTGLESGACLGVRVSAVVRKGEKTQRATIDTVVTTSGTGAGAATTCPDYTELPHIAPQPMPTPKAKPGPGEGTVRITADGAFTRTDGAWANASDLDRKLKKHEDGTIAEDITVELDELTGTTASGAEAESTSGARDWVEVRIRSAEKVQLTNPADPRGTQHHPGGAKTVTMRMTDPTRLVFDAAFPTTGPHCLGLDIAAAGRKEPAVATTLHYGLRGADARTCPDPRDPDAAPDDDESEDPDDSGDPDDSDTGDDGDKDDDTGEDTDSDDTDSRDSDPEGGLSLEERRTLADQGAVFGSDIVASAPVPGLPLVQSISAPVVPAFGLMCTPAAAGQRVQVRSGLTQLAITHDFTGPRAELTDLRTHTPVTRQLADVDYVLPATATLTVGEDGLGDIVKPGDELWASSQDGMSAPAIGIAAVGGQLRGSVEVGIDTVAGPGDVALIGTDEFGDSSLLAAAGSAMSVPAGGTEFPRFAFTQPGTYTVNTVIRTGNSSTSAQEIVVPLHFSVGEVASPVATNTALAALVGTCTDVSMASTLAQPDLPEQQPSPETAPPPAVTGPAAWMWLVAGLGMGIALTAAGWGTLLLVRSLSPGRST